MTAVITSEPLTYTEHGERSFFHDLALSGRNDEKAKERLARHQQEMAVETRATPSTTTGIGGELAPPLWVIGATGPAVNAGRIIPDLLDRVGNLFTLPRGVSSVNVPIITAGASDQIQSGQNVGVQDTDMTTSSGKSTVVTLAGDADVAQQLLDLTPAPGFDRIVLDDLTASYNAQLETQLVTGSGTGQNLLGLLNVTNIVKFAAGAAVVPANMAGASNMIAAMWQVLGSLLAQVGNGRQQAARHFLMAPRRWAAISASLDQQGRPVSVPGSDAPHQPDWPEVGDPRALTQAVGPIMGCPVWQSGILGPPTNAATAQGAQGTDTVLVIRPRDLLMWESTPGFMVAPNPLSGTLGVRLQLHRYVAFVAGRYPSGIGAATGLIQPTTGLTGVTF